MVLEVKKQAAEAKKAEGAILEALKIPIPSGKMAWDQAKRGQYSEYRSDQHHILRRLMVRNRDNMAEATCIMMVFV